MLIKLAEKVDSKHFIGLQSGYKDIAGKIAIFGYPKAFYRQCALEENE